MTDEQIQDLTDAICRGAELYLAPNLYEEITRSWNARTPNSQFLDLTGVKIHCCKYLEPGSLVAIPTPTHASLDVTFGEPRLKPVLDRLLNLKEIQAATEMEYWRALPSQGV